MARLTDPEIERCYRNALANWRYTGFIEYKNAAELWLRQELPKINERRFSELLYNYVVQDGGEIDQVVEQRELWRELFSHHYDLRPVVNGIKLYVETCLVYNNPTDPDDPRIFVVNIHLA